MIVTRMVVQRAEKLAKDINTAAVGVQPAIDKVTMTYGQLLQTRIQAKASGRPGPNAPTGDYRRSWNTRIYTEMGAAVADVGTSKPQGRRLEFGFHGADALGRVFDQPPYPHVMPALREIEPRYRDACQAAVASFSRSFRS